VVAVSVAVIADVLLMSTEVGERLQVAGLAAPVGPLTVQLRSTVPVNELDGVTVMVEVLPEVAPGLTVMLPLLVKVKLVLLPLGACQKSPQPARNGRTARKTPAHLALVILARPIPARLILARLIAAPRGLDCGPDSSAPIRCVNSDSPCRFLTPIPVADSRTD
jgi:hypothetical protein